MVMGRLVIISSHSFMHACMHAFGFRHSLCDMHTTVQHTIIKNITIIMMIMKILIDIVD
jgi:hypothetical protein